MAVGHCKKGSSRDCHSEKNFGGSQICCLNNQLKRDVFCHFFFYLFSFFGVFFQKEGYIYYSKTLTGPI